MMQANLGYIEHVLSFPRSLSMPQKRWQTAFAAIYCSRAFIRLTKLSIATPKMPHSPSYKIINIDADDSRDNYFSNHSTLAHLVKHKNLVALRDLGGTESVASSLKTDLDKGIQGGARDLERRQETFGSNTYTKPPSKGFFHFVYEAFKNLTILILLFCAALSLGFGIKENGITDGWYDGGSIFVAVFLVIAVSAVSNYKQSRQFDKLWKESSNIKFDVVRGGRWQQVSVYDIVVGDVVCLKIGDQVPADGLFIDGHSLQIDESSMTGESDHVEVDRVHSPFLISGTKVGDGFGRMLVTSVGMNTTWGEMMSPVSRDTNEETPLQVRLNKLTSSIGNFGLAVAFLVLVVMLVRYFTGNTTDEGGNRQFNGSKTNTNNVFNAVVKIVAHALTIVVVAIPEGLPLAVTLNLAYSMKKMMADMVMVRKLSACETMGSATVICTDKIGTLTINTYGGTVDNIHNQDPVPPFENVHSRLKLAEQTIKNRLAKEGGNSTAFLSTTVGNQSGGADNGSTSQGQHHSHSSIGRSNNKNKKKNKGKGGNNRGNNRSSSNNHGGDRNNRGGGNNQSQQQWQPRPIVIEQPLFQYRPFHLRGQWAIPPCLHPMQQWQQARPPRTPSNSILGPQPQQAYNTSFAPPSIGYAPTDIAAEMHTLTLTQPDANWYMDTGAISDMTAD